MTLNWPVINGLLYDSQVSRTYITNAKCECSTAIHTQQPRAIILLFFLFFLSRLQPFWSKIEPMPELL